MQSQPLKFVARLGAWLVQRNVLLASQTTQAKFLAIQGLLLWLVGLTLWRIYKRLRA
ncbi:MAG: hypothetical protein HN835_05895 [Rhodobiaceae bacterium]|nr:hypothetical protein [Rhodobiaceae bacterium]